MSVLNINRGNSTSNPYYVQLSGGVIQPARTVTAATDTATINDYLILCNAASNAITEKLPAGLSSVQTMVLVIKKTDASANVVTISGGASTIDGMGTLTLYTQNSSATLQWNGTAWSITDFNAGNWGSWTPTVGAGGSMTTSGTTFFENEYVRKISEVSFLLYAHTVLGGTASNFVSVSLPIPCVTVNNTGFVTVGIPAGQPWQPFLSFYNPGGSLLIQLQGLVNFPLGSLDFTTSGTYRIS